MPLAGCLPGWPYRLGCCTALLYAFRFSGECPGPRGSTRVRLIRPDDLFGHLGVQDRPHVSTTVVSTALAAGSLSGDPIFRSRGGESRSLPTGSPTMPFPPVGITWGCQQLPSSSRRYAGAGYRPARPSVATPRSPRTTPASHVSVDGAGSIVYAFGVGLANFGLPREQPAQPPVPDRASPA